MFAADAKFAIHAPRTTTFGTKHTQVMFHGDQHDVRIFQTEVTFRLALVKRTLAFGVRVQRVVAVWVLIVGNRPFIPTTAHRQRVDNRNLARTVAFRISSHIQHEEAMFETSVVRYVRLLFQSLQQTDLSLRPLIEQAEAGRTITYIDTGQIENQRITERRVLGRNAERQTRLTIRIAPFRNNSARIGIQ